jgi:hypothetical protein
VRIAWRWLRTSNSYRLMMPETPIADGIRLRRPLPATTNQRDRGEENEPKKGLLLALLSEGRAGQLQGPVEAQWVWAVKLGTDLYGRPTKRAEHVRPVDGLNFGVNCSSCIVTSRANACMGKPQPALISRTP